ncbi:MAG: GAF domain-containing protein [Chloroflexi bacterium]|nr:MAG: GAF domain-containing protein [Chloroflexota bacterium]MBL1196871.1 GAF domain-containing protein [Chloroflexota bacterium]NOH14167.1 GAF domain-containing protein [Chloroflexota bacterium]
MDNNQRLLQTTTDTGSLRPAELEVVYAISRMVAETIDIEESLDRIIRLARTVLIFDNVVLYLQSEHSSDPKDTLEPTFARAVGRGRSSVEEMVWGEKAAFEVYESGRIFIKEADSINDDEDRLSQHFYLGLPMLVSGEIIGALIFIRFGGPNFDKDQINLAEFIAAHVSQLLSHKQLVERIANLEAERRLVKLQDDFIAAVSHELNTPLGFIKGYTTTLLRDDTKWDDKTRNEFLQIIDEESDRLSELIGNLLDSSRLQSGNLHMDIQEQDIRSFLGSVVNRLRSHYEKLDITVKAPNPEERLKADTKRLNQVLDNLINNAAKYAPQSKPRIQFKANKKRLRISIEDEGPGISDEHLDSIFKRFYRVPENSTGVRGSGLGLFICEQIVQEHDGKIYAESKLGEGTTFHVEIPLLPLKTPKEETES